MKKFCIAVFSLLNPFFWMKNGKMFLKATKKGWNEGVNKAFRDVDSL